MVALPISPDWSAFLAASRFFPSSTVTTVTEVATRETPVGQWVLLRADGRLCQVLLDATGDVLGSAAAGRWGFEVATGRPAPAAAHPLGKTQTNSSIVVGDAIVKFFRNIEPGTNPDVEVGRALSGRAPVAPLLGEWSLPISGVDTSLAMVQQRVPGEDGFELALHAARQNTDYPAYELGRAVAQVHEQLAVSFPTGSEDLPSRLEARLPEDPAVASFLPAARDLYARLGSHAVQRIHGDLHLGQTLYGPDGWVIIDFEGEPDRPLAERTRLSNPMQDVAGMLRSFHYAGALAENPQWAERHAQLFQQGYGVPADEQAVLDAFLVDKALYEAVYELHHRPEWAWVPQKALATLLPGSSR